MENSKDGNPSNNNDTNFTILPDVAAVENDTTASVVNNNNPRTPFTNLSQVDADLALARTLQDQVSFIYLFIFLLT